MVTVDELCEIFRKERDALRADLERATVERDLAIQQAIDEEFARKKITDDRALLTSDLQKARARVARLEEVIRLDVSACYCDDADGNCNPPHNDFCERCARLSAALAEREGGR